MKLQNGAADDTYEQQADWVADRVVPRRIPGAAQSNCKAFREESPCPKIAVDAKGYYSAEQNRKLIRLVPLGLMTF